MDELKTENVFVDQPDAQGRYVESEMLEFFQKQFAKVKSPFWTAAACCRFPSNSLLLEEWVWLNAFRDTQSLSRRLLRAKRQQSSAVPNLFRAER